MFHENSALTYQKRFFLNSKEIFLHFSFKRFFRFDHSSTNEISRKWISNSNRVWPTYEKSHSNEKNEIQNAVERWKNQVSSDARSQIYSCYLSCLRMPWNFFALLSKFTPEDKWIKREDKILFGLSRTTWDQLDEFESIFAPAFFLEFISCQTVRSPPHSQDLSLNFAVERFLGETTMMEAKIFSKKL